MKWVRLVFISLKPENCMANLAEPSLRRAVLIGDDLVSATVSPALGAPNLYEGASYCGSTTKYRKNA